uniref:Uncharacterized protein n=1 Tax=Timema tahoe TaxID=61484 RepID=A0A7R9IMT6_9NEOP|nr:unnamed protein product [Timema tahoe]
MAGACADRDVFPRTITVGFRHDYLRFVMLFGPFPLSVNLALQCALSSACSFISQNVLLSFKRTKSDYETGPYTCLAIELFPYGRRPLASVVNGCGRNGPTLEAISLQPHVRYHPNCDARQTLRIDERAREMGGGSRLVRGSYPSPGDVPTKHHRILAPSRLEQNNEHVRDKCGRFSEQNIVTKCVCSVRHRSTSCRFLPVASKDARVRSCSSLDASANIYPNISPNIQSLAGQQWSHTVRPCHLPVCPHALIRPPSNTCVVLALSGLWPDTPPSNTYVVLALSGLWSISLNGQRCTAFKPDVFKEKAIEKETWRRRHQHYRQYGSGIVPCKEPEERAAVMR